MWDSPTPLQLTKQIHLKETNKMKKIINFFKGTWAKVKAFFSNTIDLAVVIVTASILALAAIFSTGMLHTGAVAGGAMVLSIGLLFVTLPGKWQTPTVKFLAKQGFWPDIIVTGAATLSVFFLPPTMSIVALFLGFCFSATLAIIRIAHRMMSVNTIPNSNLVTA